MNRSSSLPSRSSTPSAAYRAEVSSRAASTTDISTASRSNSESSAVPTSISRRKRSSDVWRGDWSEESIPPIIHLFRSQIQVRRPGRDDRTATTSTCRYYRDGTVLLRGAGEQQDGEETEAGRERARALVLTLLRRWYEGGDGQVEHPATAYRLKYPDRLWAGVAEGQVADQRRDEETHSHQARPTGDSADRSPPRRSRRTHRCSSPRSGCPLRSLPRSAARRTVRRPHRFRSRAPPPAPQRWYLRRARSPGRHEAGGCGGRPRPPTTAQLPAPPAANG